MNSLHTVIGSLAKGVRHALFNANRVSIFARYWCKTLKLSMGSFKVGKRAKPVLAIKFVNERRQLTNPKKIGMNNKLNARERRHLAAVKEMPCGVCGAAGPSDAHHIDQGYQYLCIPLCKDCHQGSFNGIHGQQRIWKVMKKTELTVLNDTIRHLTESKP